MSKSTYLFTSESVSCGHPDKVCDQISDAVLDEFLAQDPDAKVAIECFITDNMLVIGGEAHSTADVNINEIAKSVIREIGYDGTNGFNPDTAIFINAVHEQSSDIRQGVDRGVKEDTGAGDQGIMFGYACKETKELLPATIVLANETMLVYDTLRKAGELWGCRPDAKCQYTIEYDSETNLPIRIDTILISMQHDPDVTNLRLEDYFVNKILPIVKEHHKDIEHLFTDDYKLLINPTGRFVVGGPQGDTGLTGRKIIVDTYGGRCPHGGGAFSGKDCTKVDRSATYGARYIAKLLVKSGAAEEATVQLSYAIGVPRPLSILVKGKLNYPVEKIETAIREFCPLTPYQFITTFGLKRSGFLRTATYGHFRDEYFPWETILPEEIEKFKTFLQ